MQDGAPSAATAAAWLREHFKDDPEPEIAIGWREEKPISSAAQRRVLEILFSPRADSPSA